VNNFKVLIAANVRLIIGLHMSRNLSADDPIAELVF